MRKGKEKGATYAGHQYQGTGKVPSGTRTGTMLGRGETKQGPTGPPLRGRNPDVLPDRKWEAEILAAYKAAHAKGLLENPAILKDFYDTARANNVELPSYTSQRMSQTIRNAEMEAASAQYPEMNPIERMYGGAMAPYDYTMANLTGRQDQIPYTEEALMEGGASAPGVGFTEGMGPGVAATTAATMLAKAHPLVRVPATIGTGISAAFAQPSVQQFMMGEKLGPRYRAAQAQSAGSNPYGYLGGNIAGGVGGVPRNPLVPLRQAGSYWKAGPAGRAMWEPENVVAGKQAAQEVATGFGLGAGIPPAIAIASGQNPDWIQSALGGLGGVALNPTNMRLPFGYRGTPGEPTPLTVPEVEMPPPSFPGNIEGGATYSRPEAAEAFAGPGARTTTGYQDPNQPVQPLTHAEPATNLGMARTVPERRSDQGNMERTFASGVTRPVVRVDREGSTRGYQEPTPRERVIALPHDDVRVIKPDNSQYLITRGSKGWIVLHTPKDGSRSQVIPGTFADQDAAKAMADQHYNGLPRPEVEIPARYQRTPAPAPTTGAKSTGVPTGTPSNTAVLPEAKGATQQVVQPQGGKPERQSGTGGGPSAKASGGDSTVSQTASVQTGGKTSTATAEKAVATGGVSEDAYNSALATISKVTKVHHLRRTRDEQDALDSARETVAAYKAENKGKGKGAGPAPAKPDVPGQEMLAGTVPAGYSIVPREDGKGFNIERGTGDDAIDIAGPYTSEDDARAAAWRFAGQKVPKTKPAATKTEAAKPDTPAVVAGETPSTPAPQVGKKPVAEPAVEGEARTPRYIGGDQSVQNIGAIEGDTAVLQTPKGGWKPHKYVDGKWVPLGTGEYSGNAGLDTAEAIAKKAAAVAKTPAPPAAEKPAPRVVAGNAPVATDLKKGDVVYTKSGERGVVTKNNSKTNTVSVKMDADSSYKGQSVAWEYGSVSKEAPTKGAGPAPPATPKGEGAAPKPPPPDEVPTGTTPPAKAPTGTAPEGSLPAVQAKLLALNKTIDAQKALGTDKRDYTAMRKAMDDREAIYTPAIADISAKVGAKGKGEELREIVDRLENTKTAETQKELTDFLKANGIDPKAAHAVSKYVRQAAQDEEAFGSSAGTTDIFGAGYLTRLFGWDKREGSVSRILRTAPPGKFRDRVERDVNDFRNRFSGWNYVRNPTTQESLVAPGATPNAPLPVRMGWLDRQGGEQGRTISRALTTREQAVTDRMMAGRERLQEVKRYVESYAAEQGVKGRKVKQVFDDLINWIEMDKNDPRRLNAPPQIKKALELYDGITEGLRKSHIDYMRNTLGQKVSDNWGLTEQGYFKHLFMNDFTIRVKNADKYGLQRMNASEDIHAAPADNYLEMLAMAKKLEADGVPLGDIEFRARSIPDVSSTVRTSPTRFFKMVNSTLKNLRDEKTGQFVIPADEVAADYRAMAQPSKDFQYATTKNIGSLMKRAMTATNTLKNPKGWLRDFDYVTNRMLQESVEGQEITKLRREINPILQEWKASGNKSQQMMADQVFSMLDRISHKPTDMEISLANAIGNLPAGGGATLAMRKDPLKVMRFMTTNMQAAAYTVAIRGRPAAALYNSQGPLITLGSRVPAKDFANAYWQYAKPATRARLRNEGIMDGRIELVPDPDNEGAFIPKKVSGSSPLKAWNWFTDVSAMNRAIGYLYGENLAREAIKRGVKLTEAQVRQEGLTWAHVTEYRQTPYHSAPHTQTEFGKFATQFQGYTINNLEDWWQAANEVVKPVAQQNRGTATRHILKKAGTQVGLAGIRSFAPGFIGTGTYFYMQDYLDKHFGKKPMHEHLARMATHGLQSGNWMGIDATANLGVLPDFMQVHQGREDEGIGPKIGRQLTPASVSMGERVVAGVRKGLTKNTWGEFWEDVLNTTPLGKEVNAVISLATGRPIFFPRVGGEPGKLTTTPDKWRQAGGFTPFERQRQHAEANEKMNKNKPSSTHLITGD